MPAPPAAARGQARQVEAGAGLGGVLKDEHHLEQRVPGEGPGRVEGLDEVLERQVLVGVGGQVGLPDPVEQLPEGGVAGGVGAQHQGVDEEADQVVERLVGRGPRRGAERDVGARAEPGEQGGEPGLDDHEHGRAGGAGQLDQAPVQVGVEGGPEVAAPVGGAGRARPVGGEVELLGQPGERRRQ